MVINYLEPVHDSAKSFYRKAYVREYGNDTTNLYSYETHVASVFETPNGRVASVYNVESQTTLRHVKEFLKQQGFKAETKKQIVEDYFSW